MQRMKFLHPDRVRVGTTYTLRSIYAIFLVPLVGLLLLSLFISLYFSPLKHLSQAHASGFTQLAGHVPDIITKSQLLGPTDPTTAITLSVGLRLRNQADLENYVHSLEKAHAQQAHPHMTLDQIVKAYGPLPNAQQAVTTYMQQSGFMLVTTFKHHLMMSFYGTIGSAVQAFSIQINNYRTPHGRTFYAPTTNPSVPTTLSGIIQSINGLDTATHYTHPPVVAVKSSHGVLHSNASTCLPASTTPASYYIPSQLATTYNLQGLYSQGLRGEGQSIALFELDDYAQSDIAAYTSCYGGATVPISRIQVAGGSGAHPGNGTLEVELDMELVLSAAPHLANLRVYEAPNTDGGVIAEWGQIVSDAIPVVSTSWGACEQMVTKAAAQLENALFTVAAAQGQTLLAASGDHSTDDCDGQAKGVTASVDDPASQPYVTGVGGTSLSATISPHPVERYWQQGTSNGHTVGGGGGISTFWTQPTWQQGPGVNNRFSSAAPCAAITGHTGKTCREVPDVSLNADPSVGYPTYCTVTAANCSTSQPWATVGGTSAAAPMWAAMVALANQKSLQDGNFNLGFLNPLLYGIAQNPGQYAKDFNDITIGNSSAFHDGKYPATPGYDMTTGLGSYNAQQLVIDLETLAASLTKARTAAAAATWYFAEGSVGNSFQEYLTLLNTNTTQTANVTTIYLFEHKPSIKKQHAVAPSTRVTVSVNGDLNVAPTDPQQAVATIVQATIPIVAERPLYFNFHGVNSGTDVVGATDANQTSFYFAEGDTRQDATRAYSTYITLLNPSTTQTAHVTINYYNNGLRGTQTLSVGPMQRGTGTPAAVNLYQQVAIQVTSDSGIVAERPLYFRDTIPTAGGKTIGAASATGTTTLGTNGGSDWLFAEGFTGHNFQEYLVLANFTDANVTANVKLEYTNGSTQTIPIRVAAKSQSYFDVNNAFNHPAVGCTPTAEVSAEVTTGSAAIVAERLMYFHFGGTNISGGTDVVGEAGPASHTAYSFAEGYTYNGFSEFLTLQNPTNNAAMVAITLFADGTVIQVKKQLSPHSRTTLDVNGVIVPMANAYPTNPISRGYEVSMNVQALSGVVVAERPLYFNFHGDMGGTDVLGYT
ncbi:MAG: hypothetical protein NVS4B1_12620 [Ktedonobacteraceae bacterium]